MGLMIIGGFLIWLSAWISWELIKYNYNKKVRPYANDFIYRLEAHYLLYRLRVDVKAKEIKKRDNTPLEEVQPDYKPRCWEWSTNYRKDNNIITYSTELIENGD